MTCNILVPFSGLLLVMGFWGKSASAKDITIANNDNVHFSQQNRLGFHSGDDWEPSITSDSFGHIYAMFKHYDISGGQTCTSCNLRMVFQRSSDYGRTWSQPRAIAPIPFKGKSGQDDPQIVVDPVDGRTVWASFMVSYPKAYIAVTKSTDDGLTYSTRVDVSEAPAGVNHCFPALTVGEAAGDVRIGWMDKRTGAWNLFFRESSNGGDQFSRTIRISGFVQGYPYLTKAGYHLPYGDYLQMTVDQQNQTQIAWGEGPSYAGPGNQWTSHSIDD